MVEVSALLVSIIGLVLQGKQLGADKPSPRLKQSLFGLNEFARSWGALARELQERVMAWQSSGYPEDNDHGLLRALDKKRLWMAKGEWMRADVEPLLNVYAPDLDAYNRLLELKRRSEENLEVLAGRLVGLFDQGRFGDLDQELRDFYARTDEVLLAVENFRRFLTETYPLKEE